MSHLVLKPRMSEKSYAMSNDRVYVFDVSTDVNKHEITDAVEETYGVTVINIRTITVKGKAKRLYRNRRYENGRRSDIQKAYVTLKEGDAIPIFAAVEEAEIKAEKTAKTLEKVAEKQAKKESKKADKKSAKGKE
jgi:large subunit ribosomal protein L23